MNFKSRYRTVFSACLLIMFIVMAGCARKIVNSGDNVNVTVELGGKMLSPGAINSVDHFELLVEGDDFGSILVPMVPDQGLIFAVVEVPSGQNRTFTARAYDKDGVLLYEGKTASDIAPNVEVTLDISLFPVVPMINITPHYQNVQLNDSFYVDISIFNVPGVTDITLEFTRNDSPCNLLSVVKGADYGDTIALWYEGGFLNMAIGVYSVSGLGTIVDESGYAHLATVGFRSYRDWEFDTATVLMQVIPTSIYAGPDNPIPVGGIFTDGAMVELYWPDTLIASTWEKTIGGPADDIGHSACAAHDGNLIVAGTTASSGAGQEDVYLAKIDLAGTVLWEKTYGGALGDFGYCVAPTTDGGYIITGSSESSAVDGLPPDLYLIKTDAFGSTEWEKTYGAGSVENGYSVSETQDGGYIATGGVSYAEASLVYAIRIGQNGDSIWASTYSLHEFNKGRSVAVAPDGNYVIAGNTYGIDYLSEACLTFVNSQGGLIRQMTHGGIGFDDANDLSLASDGGYIVIGSSSSSGAGLEDVYALKTNSVGQFSWSKTYGFAGNDHGHSIASTRDQGFILAGSTRDVGSPSNDVYVIKTLSNGSTNWYSVFGGAGDDVGYSVMRTSDGGYFVIGYTNSFGAGGNDIYLLKTDTDGNVAPSAFSKFTGIVKRFENR